MTYTPIPKGTENWDVPVNAAFESQDVRLSAAEDDLLAQAAAIGNNATNISNLATRMNAAEGEIASLNATTSATALPVLAQAFPPECIQNATSMGAGNVIMIRVDLPADATVTNLVVAFVAAGSGLTAGQNFGGLYNSAGTLIASTADQSTAWTTAGAQTMPLTSPIALTAGTYYVAVMANGTTRPTLARAASLTNSETMINYGLSAAQYRWAFGGVGLTALPATVTMGTRTILGAAFWAAIS